ncbi:unnamed protein product [Alternaria alternata]|uniref:Uncharacterized protein n=1 Tax=Alternaria alternata TaxID=5599 RepID=A0A4Q4NA57_ALTAL|nr:hypothetical protein AA0117_g8468 [Alternaria alternata]
MFTNNDAETGAVSAPTSQTEPLTTPKVNRPHKRRRSGELPQSERPALRPRADSSNGQTSQAPKRGEKRRLNDTADKHKEGGVRKVKRQRTSGVFNSAHNTEKRRPPNQEETRQQPKQTTGWHSTDTIVARRDEIRVGIVTLQPVIFGVASSPPNALRSFKHNGHLTPAQSSLVPQNPASPPFASYKSLKGGFASLLDDNESVLKNFVKTKEELFGKPAAGDVKQTLAHNPRHKKAFDVWKDVSLSSDIINSISTAPGLLADKARTLKDGLRSRNKPWEIGQKPVAIVRRRWKRMRVEEGEHYHPNVRDFRFSCKRKAEDDLREGSFKRVKMLRDQPFPLVRNGESQSLPVQEFTSEYFTEVAKPLPSEILEKLSDALASHQKDPLIRKDIYSLAKAQRMPVAESEPILNDKSSLPDIDNETSIRKPQTSEDDGKVFRLARFAPPGLQYTADEPSQYQESFPDDEAKPRVLNNHRAPPPAAGGVVASEAASIIVPTTPSWIAEGPQYSIGIDVAYSEGYDTEYPRNYEHYLAQFTARPAFPRAKEYEYSPMPEMLDVEIINQRLNWVVPNDGEALRLLRELPVPPFHIDSELARCVRFAQSDSQQRVDWRVHPNHVAEIIQRTNFYGMELLISRGFMRISCPPTIGEFELAMATRLAHASFGKDPVAYVAADVRALADYLVEDIPSAMSLIPKEEKDHFSDFSKFYRVKLAEKYPPFDAVGLATWRLLLKGELGQPSLKAQSLRYVIDSIEQQTAQALSDRKDLQSLVDEASVEDVQPKNEDVTSRDINRGSDHGLNGGNLEDAFGWTIGKRNADIWSLDCIQAWEDFTASPDYQSNNQGAVGSFSGLIYDSVAEGTLQSMADLYSSHTFWSN